MQNLHTETKEGPLYIKCWIKENHLITNPSGVLTKWSLYSREYLKSIFSLRVGRVSKFDMLHISVIAVLDQPVTI